MKQILFLGIVFISACSPTFYYPNMQNIPAFKEKGEFKGSAVSTDMGYEAQMAYAVSNNIGVMVNFMKYREDDEDDAYKTPGRGRGIEVGGGYFFKKRNLVFESYALFGNGKVENGQGVLNGSPFQPYGNLSANLYRVAIQPSATYCRKMLEVAISSRLSYVNYYNVSKSTYIFNNLDIADNLRKNTAYYFLEPALTIRIGLKNVKIQFQTQKSFLLNRKNLDKYFYWNDATFLGLIFSL